MARLMPRWSSLDSPGKTKATSKRATSIADCGLLSSLPCKPRISLSTRLGREGIELATWILASTLYWYSVLWGSVVHVSVQMSPLPRQPQVGSGRAARAFALCASLRTDREGTS